MVIAEEDNGVPVQPCTGQIGTLLALNALYVGFGTVVGTVQGGLPPVLRQQGYDVGTLGWIYAFYLPFGLAFLWAHFIDRLRLPYLGHRTGWIAAMQMIAVSAVVVVAFAEKWPAAWLVALGFTVSFAMATMDTALDAFAVERIAPQRRSLASGLKLGALALGAMIGNGAFVIAFSRVGWIATFFCLACILVVLTLPLLTLREKAGSKASSAALEKASLLRVLLDAERRNRLLLITLVSCSIFPLAGLNRIMLVDAGVPLATIGWVVGTLGPISMLVISIVSVPLMVRAGLQSTFLLFALPAVLAVGLLAFSSAQTIPSLAIGASIITGAMVSGIYVTVMAKILGWSAGPQPATDYAAYYGISRLASTIITIVAAQLAARIDWTFFYATGAITLAVVLFFANLSIFRREI